MKKIVLTAILSLVFSFTLWAEDIQRVDINANMTCQNCENRITKSLKNTEGVKKVKTELKTKIVKVEYDKDIISEEKIIEKISNLGYEATKKSETKTKDKK